MTNNGLGLPVGPSAAAVPAVVTEEPRNVNGLTAWQMIAAGRRFLRTKAPYLDSAVLMLAPVEARGLGTIAVTDTMILLVDPEYVVQQTVEACAADIVHEISHILRDTHGRTLRLGCCTEDQRKISNVASDIAINTDVEAMGLPIISAPVPGVHAKQFGLPEGLLHEEYYYALLKQAEKNNGQLCFRIGKGKGKKGKGEDGESEGEAGNGDKPSCGRGWCGSGGGHAVPNEPSQDDSAGRDPSQMNNGNGGYPGRTPSEIDRARRHVAEAIVKHAQAGRGNIPGGWQRWADDLLEPPKVPWQQKLARMARQALRYRMGACDLKYNDVSRRQAGVGYGPGKPIMPKFKAPVIEAVIAADTSGSMGTEDFNKMMPEIESVIRACGGDVWFAAMDAAVHEFKKIKRWEEAKNLLTGGGGTDFNPFFNMLAGMKRCPKVIIVCTDGDASVPAEAPLNMSVIWVLTRVGASAPCAWGESLNVAEE